MYSASKCVTASVERRSLLQTRTFAPNTRPKATTRELADAVDCSKEHVRDTLARLVNRGTVDQADHAGPYGADVYRDAGADRRATSSRRRPRPTG